MGKRSDPGARSRLRRVVGMPWSFRRQIVVLTAAVTAVAMLLLSLVLQVVLARITNNDVDRVLEDRATAAVSAIQASSTDGSIVVPDATLDAGVAVFDASSELVAGSTPRSLHEYYEDLASSQMVVVEDAGGESRVRSQPFSLQDGTAGVVVVTERLDPYEEAESLALLVSLVTGALAIAATAGIAAWTVRRALRPVAEMAATAADWSEHSLGRRFGLGAPTNEISALAGTLDTLLEKVSQAIRSEQRLTSELAHELRTPLTSIQGTADLMLMRDGSTFPAEARADLMEIAASSRRMATTITTLLDLARSESSMTAAGTSDLAAVVEEVIAQADTGTTQVTVAIDIGGAILALPHALVVRTISPVVDNALRFARSEVAVTASVVAGRLEVLVTDDGPGVGAELAGDIFEPGRTSGTADGAGLGLAIARRIARAAGGDVDVVPRDGAPGGRFVVHLPLA